jgi:short-subunit dehydrogenase
MIRRGHGGLLNVASGAAFQPCPFMAVYAAAKAYTLSVTEALWEEARGTGVRVSCLCPGPTESGFHTRSGTDNSKAGKGPMHTAREVAELGYAALIADKRVIVPGFGNRVKAVMGTLLPNGLIMKGVRKVFT